MQNWPETLFKGFKDVHHPLVHGEQEKMLKETFMIAMYSGHQLAMQSTKLSDKDCSQFNTEILAQIKGSLSQMGCKPPHINVQSNKLLKPNGFGG